MTREQLEAYGARLADRRFRMSDREASYGFEQGFEAACDLLFTLAEDLAFYADKSNWKGRRGEDHFTEIKFDGHVGGERARKTLADLEAKVRGGAAPDKEMSE